MTAYGDQEIAMCFAGTQELRRYFISDGVEARTGAFGCRRLCVRRTELKDGRLAYANAEGIRVTAL